MRQTWRAQGMARFVMVHRWKHAMRFTYGGTAVPCATRHDVSDPAYRKMSWWDDAVRPRVPRAKVSPWDRVPARPHSLGGVPPADNRNRKTSSLLPPLSPFREPADLSCVARAQPLGHVAEPSDADRGRQAYCSPFRAAGASELNGAYSPPAVPDRGRVNRRRRAHGDRMPSQPEIWPNKNWGRGRGEASV